MLGIFENFLRVIASCIVFIFVTFMLLLLRFIATGCFSSAFLIVIPICVVIIFLKFFVRDLISRTLGSAPTRDPVLSISPDEIRYRVQLFNYFSLSNKLNKSICPTEALGVAWAKPESVGILLRDGRTITISLLSIENKCRDNARQDIVEFVNSVESQHNSV